MEIVDTKQLDLEITQTKLFIDGLEMQLKIKKSKLESLKERKKSIELYNKKS
jgi:hypothetical protein